MSADDLPSRVVAGISFVGRAGGWVKDVDGFKQGHHSVPDAANAITNGFLGKICARELTDESGKLFEEVRTALGYKRPQVALSVTSPLAVLGAKDFSVEWFYPLEERAPARYTVSTALRGLMSVELTRTDAFARVFAEFADERRLGRFAGLNFPARKFPFQPEVLVRGALRDEHAVVAVLDDGGEDGNGFFLPRRDTDEHGFAAALQLFVGSGVLGA